MLLFIFEIPLTKGGFAFRLFKSGNSLEEEEYACAADRENRPLGWKTVWDRGMGKVALELECQKGE